MTANNRSWVHDGIDVTAYTALTSGLPASRVWSLLMSVVEARAAQRTEANLLQQWQQDRFVQPCYVDQRTLNELDSHLLAAAASFEAIELAPVAPLGTCSAVALASQNKVVSTVRGTEVVSDPTNVLALECARRLRENRSGEVRLATSHRCVRAQAVPKVPGFAAHFRMFCLASAGHERENRDFTALALIEHIRTHLAALDRLERHGYAFPGRRLRVLASARNQPLAERVVRSIAGVPVTREPLEHDYYDGLRFMIHVQDPQANEIPFIDGGVFNWLKRLTSNGKLSFVASGMGSQLAAFLFRNPAAGSAAPR
jgi:hypothetical protein